ncbi:hypothetical protein N7488_003836 [Penicillium malachiteum]|nr:hypothetical protein N7488_003836 [Penicillium malachiteum]
MPDYQWLRNAVAVIKQHDIMKLTTLYEWLSHIDSGLFVLDKFTRAYRSASQFYVDGKLSIQFSGYQVTIQTTEIDIDIRVFEPMQLICRIVRLPEPDSSICLSQMTLLDGVYHLNKLKSLSENSVDHTCWRGLFNSMIVTDDDPQGPCRGLELDFNILIQLSAVEYHIEIDSGLILMGYSTALIHVKETDDGMILWHLEIASHESQFKVSDLKPIQGEWLKTQDLEYLQSRKILLG